jgi:hypothetical protein
MNKIKIDPEFRDLLSPLPAETLVQLEENLKRDGCREPLAVWKGHNILLDGHNRKPICDKHGIGYRISEIDLPDREAAMEWIDANQDGRRNEPPEQLSLIRGRRYNRAKAKHGGDRRSSAQNEHLKTADELAEKTGVSAATIRRDGEFADAVEKLKEVDPEIQQKVAAGNAPPKSRIVKAAKAKTKKEKKAILAGKEPSEKLAPEPAKKFPAKVQQAFETIAAFKGMIQLCTQLTAGIGKVCGDANGKPPAKGGELLAGARQEALTHIKNLRSLLTAYMPHAICPYCHSENNKCQACKGLGWVAEQTFEQAPKDKKQESLVA